MNNKGFTLVELLVTIAIVGIITGISFAAIDALRNQNENKRYKAYSDVIENAAKLYVDDHKSSIGTCKEIKVNPDLENYLNKNTNNIAKASCEDSYVIYKDNVYYPIVICGGEIKYQKPETVTTCS